MGTRQQIYTQDFSGGLVIDKLPHKLNNNQSPKMKNVLPFDRHGIMMRSGQKYRTEQPEEGSIVSVHRRPYGGLTIFAGRKGETTSLYFFSDGPYTPFYTLQSGEHGQFFEFGGLLYYLNGREYLRITVENGTAAASEVAGHIPLVYVNCHPDGEGLSRVGDFNLLQSCYRIRFIPDGTATQYVLPHRIEPERYGILSVKTLYPTKTVVTGFTVSEQDGRTRLTFNQPPAAQAGFEGGNCLEVVAENGEVDFGAEREKVLRCRLAEEYGGSLGGVTSGTRVFLSGNPDFPGSVWWSAVTAGDYSAAEYFPDRNVEVVGDGQKPVTALAKQYNELSVFKERGIYGMNYAFTGEKAVFSVREIHGRIGCDMPGSVQLINNDLCFGSSGEGIFLLISTNNNDERNVVPISANVNRSARISDSVDGILNFSQERLRAATSMDDGQRYWLCIRPYVYVWDYGTVAYANLADLDEAQNRLSWWLLDRFDALCWTGLEGATAYGSAQKLDFVVPSSQYNDFGERIDAYYRTKGYDGGDATLWKHFKQVIFSQKTVGTGQAVFRYAADTLEVEGETKETRTFTMEDFAFDSFSFGVVNYGAVHSVYPQLEHTAYFAWEVHNGQVNTDLFLTDVKTVFFRQQQDY